MTDSKAMRLWKQLERDRKAGFIHAVDCTSVWCAVKRDLGDDELKMIAEDEARENGR